MWAVFYCQWNTKTTIGSMFKNDVRKSSRIRLFKSTLSDMFKTNVLNRSFLDRYNVIKSHLSRQKR